VTLIHTLIKLCCDTGIQRIDNPTERKCKHLCQLLGHMLRPFFELLFRVLEETLGDGTLCRLYLRVLICYCESSVLHVGRDKNNNDASSPKNGEENTNLNDSEEVTTDTLLRAMAAAASQGGTIIPVKGNKMPPASGIAMTLYPSAAAKFSLMRRKV